MKKGAGFVDVDCFFCFHFSYGKIVDFVCIQHTYDTSNNFNIVLISLYVCNNVFMIVIIDCVLKQNEHLQ